MGYGLDDLEPGEGLASATGKACEATHLVIDRVELVSGTPASFAAHDLPTRYEYARHRIAEARAAFLLRYPDKEHEFDQVLEGAPAAARRARKGQP